MHLVRITRRVSRLGNRSTRRVVGLWLLTCPVAIWMASGCMSTRHQKIVPESVATCRQLARDGISAMELGNYDQACTLLQNAVETSPTDIDARRQLAEALWQMGRQQAAVVHMEAAVRLDPTHAPTLVRAGEMLHSSGNEKRALGTGRTSHWPGTDPGRRLEIARPHLSSA